MKVQRFSKLLNPRDERLPKKTGIGGKLKPMKRMPLLNPRVMLSSNAAFKAQIKQFSVTDSSAIRGEALAKLNRMAETVTRHLAAFPQYKGLRFEINEEAGKNVVIVRDMRTGEVVKSFPSESLIQIAANLRAATGVLLDKNG